MRGGGKDAGGPPRQRVKLPSSGWGAPDPAAVSGLGTAPRRCPPGLAQSLRRGGASPLRQLRRGLARLLRTIWFWVPCPKVSDLGKFLSSVIYRGGGSHSNRRVTAGRLPLRTLGAAAPGPGGGSRGGGAAAVRCPPGRPQQTGQGRREGPGCGPAGAGARGCPGQGRQRAALSAQRSAPGPRAHACAGRCPVPAWALLWHRRSRRCQGLAAPHGAGHRSLWVPFHPWGNEGGRDFSKFFWQCGGKTTGQRRIPLLSMPGLLWRIPLASRSVRRDEPGAAFQWRAQAER